MKRKKIINDGPPSNRTECDVCGRKCGTLNDRCNFPPRFPEQEEPLGEIEWCDLCGKAVCPDCLHEADCCFEDAEDLSRDPQWAPRGWKRTSATEYRRILS